MVPHFDHDYDWRTIDWHAAYVEGHATFPRSVDLFGDGSVRLRTRRAHAGHQSLLLRLSDRNLLLTGDATYANPIDRRGPDTDLHRRHARLPPLDLRDPQLPRAETRATS